MLKLSYKLESGVGLLKTKLSSFVLLGWVGQASLAWVDMGFRILGIMHMSYFRSLKISLQF